jgi:monoamine oxidase
LFLAGDFTQQEFMASIEGAIRSAKRAVARIDDAVARAG